MSVGDRAQFCKDAGLQSQLEHIILEGYKCLNLIHYFTAGPTEVRAWTVRVRLNLRNPPEPGTAFTNRGFASKE